MHILHAASILCFFLVLQIMDDFVFSDPLPVSTLRFNKNCNDSEKQAEDLQCHRVVLNTPPMTRSVLKRCLKSFFDFGAECIINSSPHTVTSRKIKDVIGLGRQQNDQATSCRKRCSSHLTTTPRNDLKNSIKRPRLKTKGFQDSNLRCTTSQLSESLPSKLLCSPESNGAIVSAPNTPLITANCEFFG